MTGRDTFLMGMQFEEILSMAPWGVPLEEVILAKRFKAAGYATHMVSFVNSDIKFQNLKSHPLRLCMPPPQLEGAAYVRLPVIQQKPAALKLFVRTRQ